MNLIAVSAKVLPTQIRLPPKKGAKLRGCLHLPSGVNDKGDLVSNRSGMNS